MTIGRINRFLKKVSHGESFSASPKQPQSSTGIHVALRKVRIVKKVIDSRAKIEISRVLTLKISIRPIINSAPHSHIENTILAGCNSSKPYIERYSLTLSAVPHGSTALTNPEKAKTTPANMRQKLAKIFNLRDGIILLSLCDFQQLA
jgi:hypothetical protein